jgi:hypothetical protein
MPLQVWSESALIWRLVVPSLGRITSERPTYRDYSIIWMRGSAMNFPKTSLCVSLGSSITLCRTFVIICPLKAGRYTRLSSTKLSLCFDGFLHCAQEFVMNPFAVGQTAYISR